MSAKPAARSKTRSGKARPKTALSDLSDKEALDCAQENTWAWQKDSLRSPSLVQAWAQLDSVQLVKTVASHFGLREYQTNLRQACLADFYSTTFWYTQQHRFNSQEASALVGLCHLLLQQIRDDANLTLETLALFVCTHMPQHTAAPGSEDSSIRFDFEAHTAKTALLYLKTGLFQHFLLFKRLFHSEQTVQHFSSVVHVPVVPPIPPMDEALLQSDRDMELHEQQAKQERAAQPLQIDVELSATATPTEEQLQRIADAAVRKFVQMKALEK
eukprot:m.122185 g.122185  ORF g.122185 m.122185 type:complete len:272 (-) comp19653_c0_seq1:13-828(-)